MTQVWMVRNSDTDIYLFNRFEHLEPSVRITFSRCTNVEILCERAERQVVFKVKAERPHNGGPIEETIIATCLPVWTEPSHL